MADIFVTRLNSDDKHLKELIHKHVEKSNADLILLMGNFNFQDTDRTYRAILNSMKDAAFEAGVYTYLPLDAYNTYTTFGNPANTFTDGNSKSIVNDYIFFKR